MSTAILQQMSTNSHTLHKRRGADTSNRSWDVCRGFLSRDDRQRIDGLVQDSQSIQNLNPIFKPPEMRALITVGKNDILASTTQVVSATNFAMALLVSGVIQFGFDPLDVATFKTRA